MENNILGMLSFDGETYQITTAGYTVLVIAMVVLLVVGSAIHARISSNRSFSAKQIAFSAIAMALALVTSNIKLFHMPMGGSVTLFSMLFVALIGYWFGLEGGITAAIAYGILQMFFGAYIISLPQMFVDYIFAFGALGLSGVGHKRPHGLILGYLLAVFGRYVFAVLSGVIFFGSYAADAGFSSPLAYSIIYNGAYLGLEALITVVILLIPPVKRAMEAVARMAE